MAAPPSASCPHHIPSHEFSCWVQGPDKGHFLPVAPGATRGCLQQAWLCGGACTTLSFLRDVEQGSHQQPPSLTRGQGEARCGGDVLSLLGTAN